MKKQKGITLIALVISIIVMLILAGVSINAIVGENGVLSRAQYSSFMNEMAAVEEAVQLWKAGELMETKGKASTAIPSKGLWERENIDPKNMTKESQRLVGEMGYYRRWSQNSKPTNDILSLDNNLYEDYHLDFIGYPAGVQDIYYLDNEALNLDKNKKYLIDAATSIVYSTTGIMVNGVRCYSTYMAKAAMGNEVEPLFIAAEMSGGGDNIIYAGETYLKDKNGNYIDENGNIVSEEDKVLNPNGFRIIADSTSNNIYKLYNNGDLYGKGVKGLHLNTSSEEMEKINSYVWNEFTIPSEIPGADSENYTIIPGASTVYVIDKNKDLWAWGSNSNNKLGLTEEQKVEYTGREAVKLDLKGEKVKTVYSGNSTFVITESNEVYAAGQNNLGQMGLGYTSTELEEFTKLNLDNVDEIIQIQNTSFGTIIWYNNAPSTVEKDSNEYYTYNSFYFAGTQKNPIINNGKSGDEYLTFTQIYDGINGDDIDHEIKRLLFIGVSSAIVKTDGTYWQIGYKGKDGSGGALDIEGYKAAQYNQFPSNFGTNVTEIYNLSAARVITRYNEIGELEVWGTPGIYNNLGLGAESTNSAKYWKIELPEDLKNEGIKEIYTTSKNVYYLSNTGKVYASGESEYTGINVSSGKVEGIQYVGLNNIKTLYDTNNIRITNVTFRANAPICFTSNDGTIYTTSNSTIVFRDEILQKNWTLVASNVKDFYCEASSAGYIDFNNNLYVLGKDSRFLGLGSLSENSQSIDNFILHPNNEIKGKVSQVRFGNAGIYIVTTDDELWGAGIYNLSGINQYPGWDTQDDKTDFIKLLDNVMFFDCAGVDKLVITKDGEAYGWGTNYKNLGFETKSSDIPVKFTLPTEINYNNISRIEILINVKSFIVTKSDGIYTCCNHGDDWYNGGATGSSVYKKYTYNIQDNTIIDVASINPKNSIMLSNNGKLFGYGTAKYLGINNTTSELIETRELSGIDNVKQIVAGNGWYIAIKNDGTVWGTGTNTYGILGRWIGIDRNSPNSRYKTAFEWVECPELEI